MSGYVMQDDLLNGSFSVLETLHYTAMVSVFTSSLLIFDNLIVFSVSL
jgi:hypothetical protein